MKDFVLLEMLTNDVVNVEFTKKDGTVRNMKCTLNVNYIPIVKQPKESGIKHSDEAQRVFDVEKNDWRSFRWDSINKYFIGD
jgi:hypothetical protein